MTSFPGARVLESEEGTAHLGHGYEWTTRLRGGLPARSRMIDIYLV